MTKVLELLEKELPKYIHEVKSKNQENAKAFAFSSFIQRVFGVESEDLDFEKSVKTEVKQMRGRIDAVFGNIIIEFKKDLTKGLEVAKEELQKYFQAYLDKGESNFLGIANDGIHFKVFYPVIESNEVVDVKEIDELNLENSNAEQVFLWFDSYFFSTEKITPTSADIKRRFGLDSPTFTSIQRKLEELFQKVESFKPAVLKYESWNKYLEIVYGDKPNDKSLFFKHTYLSTLVKLIVHAKISGGKPRDYDEIVPILFGNTFTHAGIKNFMEEDFYSWILSLPIRKQSSKIFHSLLHQIYVYDLDKIDEDVLKELYQGLVDPDVRKLLGEFYTPDWLAEKMVEEVFHEDPTKSALDPSCGSGTFLFKMIQFKIKKLSKKGWSKQKILEHILENVIGFDIHPLAVIISRTNYLLALKDIIHSRKGAISIPVYLCDSLKIPEKKMDLTTAVHTFEFDALNKKFEFPITVASNLSKMDEMIEVLREYGQELELKIERGVGQKYGFDIEEYIKNTSISFEKFASRTYNKNETSILLRSLKTLYELIKEGSDAIWPYILRNMYKPVSISMRKVDIIIGNPPWLTMQGMKNEDYQNFLKKKTFYFNLIGKKDTHQFPHLELATLFFCITNELYLKDSGEIAFVMPKSILVASHHSSFRKFNKPEMNLFKIYDAESVEPLFRIPTCVIFCKNGESTKYPVNQITMSGKLPEKNVGISKAEKFLNFEDTKYEPAYIDIKQSQYFEKFYQGATIVPRNLFFVVPEIGSSLLGINLKSPQVKSDEENDTKPPWSKITISKEIEANFLFGTLLGSDVVPFGIRRFRLVALPITVKEGKPNVCNEYADLQRLGYPNASRYFEEVEEKWNKYKTKKQKNTTIYKWINFRNKISNQNLTKKFKILYVASSTYLAACIVELDKEIIYKTDSGNILLNGFIAESKTYHFETDKKDEAHYLCAILNSKTIDDLIKPLQTRGLWGPRDIHKRPLSLPIPVFNIKDTTHKKLSKLSQTCQNKVPEYLDQIKSKQVGSIRTEIRKKLKNELEQIDKLTKEAIIKEDPKIKKLIK